MDENIRRVLDAAAALTQSGDPDKVAKGAELLKVLAETENHRVQTAKLQDELNDPNKKKKNWKELIAILSPVITSVVLAGTLFLQSYQFARTEKDKAAEAREQREAATAKEKRDAEAAEDASWADALKLLAGSEKISPAAVLLKRFSASPRYSEEARRTAIELLLAKAGDPAAFESLFDAVFQPPKWDNLPQMAQIDRQLDQRVEPIISKAFDPKTNIMNPDRLSKSDRERYDNLHTEINYVSAALGLLLRSPRPPSQQLDLHNTAIWETDLKGANLTGADINGANLSNLNIEKVDMSGVGIPEGGVALWGTAWWEASTMSPDLLAYLEKNWGVVPGQQYASGRVYNIADYNRELQRLRSAHR